MAYRQAARPVESLFLGNGRSREYKLTEVVPKKNRTVGGGPLGLRAARRDPRNRRNLRLGLAVRVRTPTREALHRSQERK